MAKVKPRVKVPKKASVGDVVTIKTIFRTDGEWQALLQAMGLQLKDTGRLFGSENPQTYYISQPNATVAKL